MFVSESGAAASLMGLELAELVGYFWMNGRNWLLFQMDQPLAEEKRENLTQKNALSLSLFRK